MNIDPNVHLFAVFDGHGGCEVAKFCEAHIIQELKADKDYQSKNYEKALTNVFLKIDKMLLTNEAKTELKSYSKTQGGMPGMQQGDLAFTAGCTANVILITETHIYCANSGDARGVVCEKGKSLDLSKDHKPDLPAERSRVIAAGHYVEESRVDGVIAISRALGDWEYKNQKLQPEKMAVSGFPDVTKTAISPNTEFIICACDGIWDCMTSQQACDFVKKGKEKLKTYVKSGGKAAGKAVGTAPKGKKSAAKDAKMETTIDNSKFKGLATVVEMIFEQNCPTNLHQSEGLGCDNMTCIIIDFNRQ
jgi:serine/threonine protein phosphatase PrpC